MQNKAEPSAAEDQWLGFMVRLDRPAYEAIRSAVDADHPMPMLYHARSLPAPGGPYYRTLSGVSEPALNQFLAAGEVYVIHRTPRPVFLTPAEQERTTPFDPTSTVRPRDMHTFRIDPRTDFLQGNLVLSDPLV